MIDDLFALIRRSEGTFLRDLAGGLALMGSLLLFLHLPGFGWI
ncbi:hypothetical protein V8J36_08680 [Frigidibacter sp. MR17.14]